jgi:hypothetical protein
VGTRSSPRTIQLQNTGATVLEFTNIQASANFAQTNTCQPSVPVGGKCSIDVYFTPATSGPVTGTLTVNSNAPGPPYVVDLSGTGIVAGLSLSPIRLDFGGQAVSTTSASQSITVTNHSNVAVTSLTITPSGDYAQTNNCGGSVAANSHCKIDVTFTPTAAGNRSGGLMLTHSAANSPQTVSLTGTGQGGTAVWLSTSSLTFPNQPVGTRSASPQVTLQNTGKQTLNITSIALTGANPGDFTLTQNCNNSLVANATCQITLAFIPSANGARSATVSIIDSAADSPQTIALSGTGIGP